MAASSSSSSVKRKRSQPGNPNPDAEVIALSPKTLMATNRFICEVCNKGFQREQNLQLHRRGHNLPWKLKQKSTKDLVRKKVYLCPEPTCAHHDPSRALGDLTGIKKHYLRKHGEKKYKCQKCAKKYAVVSDWKAHSKTCGTREYRCDCGTLFSRRDSFITHRAFCNALTQETDRNTLNPTLFGGHFLADFSRISDTTQDQININANLPFMNHEVLRYGSPPVVSQFDTLIGPAFCLPPLSMQQQQIQNNEESHLLNKPSLHSLMQQQQQISLENGVCSSSGFFNLNFFPGNTNDNDNASVQDSAIFTSGNHHHHLMNMTVPSFYNGGAGHASATTLLQKASLYGSTNSDSSPFKQMPSSFRIFEGNNHLQDMVNSMAGGGGGSSSSIIVPGPFGSNDQFGESKPIVETIHNNNNNNGLFVSRNGLDLETEMELKLTRDFMGVEREIQHRSRRISMDLHHLNSGSSPLNSFTWKPTP